MTTSYHQATLDFLKLTPATDATAVKALDDLEQRIGDPLPAALREWYSRPDARQLLRCNDDQVLPIEKLGFDDDSAPENMLMLIWENQDTAAWALEFDGTPDPPVHVTNDDYDEWIMCAPKFSEFVFGRVWDWRMLQRRDSLIIWDDTDFIADALAYFRATWSELPASYNGFWHYAPDSTVYRFQNSANYVRLLNQPAGGIACGVHSNDATILLDCLNTLRPNTPHRQQNLPRTTTYYVGNLTDKRGDFESLPF